MRSLLVPALAALLALPAFAHASGTPSAFDDASYPETARSGVIVAQLEVAPNPFDDAGMGMPEVSAATEPAPTRVAERTPATRAGCTCCQS